MPAFPADLGENQVRHSSLILLLAMAPAAWAVDANDDDCDDAFEGNGACVANEADVDLTATVGVNSEVGRWSSIGPQTDIGDGVIIGERVTLVGRASHPSNPVTIGDGTVIFRRATLGADHVIGTGNLIGRAVTAGSNLTTQADVSIGYATQLGDNVTLGQGAVVGATVDVGNFATIGTGAVLAKGVTVADSVSGQEAVINGIVGPFVDMGANVRVEQGARVRKSADILKGAHIESTGRVGRGAQIGSGATIFGRVAAGAIVGDGATVIAGGVVRRGGELCPGETLPSDGNVASGDTYPLVGCIVHSSCKTLHDSGGATTSGVYTVNPTGSQEVDVYCDMISDGGGWSKIVATTGISHDFGQTTSAIVSSYANVNATVGVFQAFAEVENYSQVMLKKTSGTGAGQFVAFNLVETISGRSVMDILQQDCRPASCLSGNANDNTHSGARVQRPVSTDARGAWTHNYSGTRYTGTISNGNPNYFFMCGVNTSSDNDQSVLAFADSQGNNNAWGDHWRHDDQYGTMWSFWNGDYHACPTTQHIGNGYSQSLAGYKTNNSSYAGSYEVYIR